MIYDQILSCLSILNANTLIKYQFNCNDEYDIFIEITVDIIE